MNVFPFDTSQIPPERRQILAEFSTSELLAEMHERGQAGTFGWLANLQREARYKAQRAADPELARKHRQIFWHLHGELRRRAGQ